ncbi:hypothetical protein PLCT2_00072 [Planctomycetaceae bacterium]|nr:hypothetical protein PLCT2_00072 [Planctomycetaceae bacterium]
MAGDSVGSRGHFESDPREFDDVAPLAGRELDASAPLSGAEADGNRLADVASGKSFGGEELHDEADFDEEEARALSEELGREFSDVEPEGAEYEDIPPDELPEQKRGGRYASSPAHKGFVRLGGRKRKQVPDHTPEGLVPDDETLRSKVLLPTPAVRPAFTAQQRFLILDIWVRSALPAGDFAPLVGVAPHTLYSWRKRFDEFGPAGLSDQPKGAPTGSRLNVATRRAIVMLKRNHPEWGCERIQDVLMRSEGYTATHADISADRTTIQAVSAKNVKEWPLHDAALTKCWAGCEHLPTNNLPAKPVSQPAPQTKPQPAPQKQEQEHET